jgi:hypothetical protein
MMMTSEKEDKQIIVRLKQSVKNHFESLKEFYGVESDEEMIRIAINETYRKKKEELCHQSEYIDNFTFQDDEDNEEDYDLSALSQSSLKDWLKPSEEKAWQHLKKEK